MEYQPSPLHTSDIELAPHHTALIDALSENVHDVWARKRMDDGWRYGPSRDDTKKTHPCLVPYADLPASEQSYDREMVEQVVRAAVALGYRIEK